MTTTLLITLAFFCGYWLGVYHADKVFDEVMRTANRHFDHAIEMLKRHKDKP